MTERGDRRGREGNLNEERKQVLYLHTFGDICFLNNKKTDIFICIRDEIYVAGSDKNFQILCPYCCK